MFSMTGYGKGVSSEGGETITVEIKTVNHRYLDLGLKLPKNFLFAEDGVKKLISSEISRGHVDLFLTYEKSAALESEYFVNVEAAKGFLKAAETLKRELKDMQVEEDVTLGYLLKLPDVVSKNLPEEQDDEKLMRLTLDATRQALANLKQMRLGEGERLKADIALKLDNIERSLEKIKALAPEVVSAYRSALYERIKGFVEENLDMQRFVTEIALYADHCAIDEEITRLSSHIKAMREMLTSCEPVGRKMDFLVQELNREANTIGSKANDLNITGEVLFIKNEIEKLREQAANVE